MTEERLQEIEQECAKWSDEHYLDRCDGWVDPTITELIAEIRRLRDERGRESETR